MSSETRFSTSHSSFWNALLPMGESYIRAQNSKFKKDTSQHFSSVPADKRGFVNEAAFLIFQEATNSTVNPLSLPAAKLDELFERARAYVSKMRGSSPITSEGMIFGVRLEAQYIALRLHSFFFAKHCPTIVKPFFPGCGWVNAAEGDVLSGFTLYEVKAGDRQFRLTDIRQVLCYAALNFSSKSYDIRNVALFNPRTGAVIEEDLEILCRKLSGTGSAAVLSEIINYVSEPISNYRAV